MKLDPRIKDRFHIFDCFSIDEAKKYIGKECYMADSLADFCDIEMIKPKILNEIKNNGLFVTYGWECNFSSVFCLPVELVKPKEKKLRPYTIKEFFNKFTVGKPFMFRRKKDKVERYLILNGFAEAELGVKSDHIYIGPFSFTLDELFREYEWKEHYLEDFEPFGIEE